MKSENKLVGNRMDWENRQMVNSRVNSLREYLLGRQGTWKFIQLADYKDIFENGITEIVERYRKELERQRDEIKQVGLKWHFEDGMELEMRLFKDHVTRVKQAYDLLTEYVPKEAFEVQEKENGFTLLLNETIVTNVIKELSNVYAVTPKQKQLYEIANKIAALHRDAKELTENPMLPLLDLVKNVGEINIEAIYNQFKKL